ncbi:MAG: WYL domain-containing protein [Candidatus Schekmanbacteria bacterium]|nr:WYL domain-containing protein [Candidatus Schekmanbacteria bacterium]
MKDIKEKFKGTSKNAGSRQGFKFTSLLIILNKIDSGEKVTVNSIVEDLEIGERTVHRYLQTLQTAGFPISYEREKKCYTFDDGYSLKKPNLSVEETLALSLARNVVKNFDEGLEQSLSKLETRLSVKNSGLTSHIVLKQDKISPTVASYSQAISQAILNYQKIKFIYRAVSTDEESIRTIEPDYLLYYDGFWNVRGYCEMDKDRRSFALDRMSLLEILEDRFLPQKVFPEDELAFSFGNVIDEKSVNIVLWFNPECKTRLLRKKWHDTQMTKELKDGRVEMRLTVNGIREIKKWIYGWIPHVEVIEPKELKKEVTCELKEALKKNL